MPTVIDGTDGVNKVDFSEIATGTPDGTTFLRGDGEWAIIPSPSTSDVLAATAGASVGAVGTYALLGTLDGALRDENSTLAGSSLRYANTASGSSLNGLRDAAPGGTWRLMGNSGYSYNGSFGNSTDRRFSVSVWLRIS